MQNMQNNDKRGGRMRIEPAGLPSHKERLHAANIRLHRLHDIDALRVQFIHTDTRNQACGEDSASKSLLTSFSSGGRVRRLTTIPTTSDTARPHTIGSKPRKL